MSRIEIDNLGPVKHFSSTTDDNVIAIIGEQASGKSTIAKSIFFCKSIADELKKYLAETELIIDTPQDKLLFHYTKRLRARFVEFFGTTKHMSSFQVKYFFDDSESIIITLQTGYANLKFSKQIKHDCLELMYKVQNTYEQQAKVGFEEALNNVWMNQSSQLRGLIDREVNRIFTQEHTPVFIPAGRSMLATNSEFFHLLTPNKYDVLMNDFIERIMILQKQYSQKMEDIVEDKKRLSTDRLNMNDIKQAMRIIRRILKGDYVNEKDGEKIYYTATDFVKLVQASSGQQESLWIVMLIFSVILSQQKVYMVVEEPEAHLFPKAQKEMIELIALMVNSTGSQVILTTHSPYVLTSLNLLMYSEGIEKKEAGVEEVVPSSYRIDSNRVSAYMLDAQKGFCVHDLMDRNNHMMDTTAIDSVSQELNDATDKLIEMEIQSELQ